MAESGVAHKDAAQSRVNIFDGEIVGACALLQFGHRSDELQTRTAINARDWQGARETLAPRPQDDEHDQHALRQHPDDGRA